MAVRVATYTSCFDLNGGASTHQDVARWTVAAVAEGVAGRYVSFTFSFACHGVAELTGGAVVRAGSVTGGARRPATWRTSPVDREVVVSCTDRAS